MPTFPHHHIKIFGLFKYINEISENVDLRKVGWGGGAYFPLATPLIIYLGKKGFLSEIEDITYTIVRKIPDILYNV